VPTLWTVADPGIGFDSDNELPGEPMISGFCYRPTREVPEARLSDEARERVLRKIESVDEARLKAAKEGHTAYVG
jgi:hypothetical protein